MQERRNGHRFDGDSGMVRTSGAALLPIHEQKMLLERGIVVAKHERLAVTRPTAQNNKGRVVSVDTAKPDTLRDAIDGYGFHRRDAAGNDVAVSIPKLFRVDATCQAKQEDTTHGDRAQLCREAASSGHDC